LTTERSSSALSGRVGWFKSSHSNASGSCVETHLTPGVALVRDSKDRRVNSPVITFSPSAWTAFLGEVTPEDA
jgi:hypothetical protein